MLQAASNTATTMLADHDHLLTDLRATLTDADADYVAALQRHAQQVDTVLTAMAQQSNELEEQCRQQLAHVAHVLQDAREDDMQRIRATVDVLLKARAEEEEHMQGAWLEQRETQWHALEAARRAAQEKYMVTKQRYGAVVVVMVLARASGGVGKDKWCCCDIIIILYIINTTTYIPPIPLACKSKQLP